MGRSPCCSKEDGLNRRLWTAQEDMILCEYIRIHGDGRWTNLHQRTGLKRCGKSCRLRWMNYLRPGIKRGEISVDEEELIIRMHRLLGNRWSLIAGRLPGRTDNEIKNYWNTHLKKKRPPIQESQGKTILKSPSPLQSNVIKSTPVRLTTAVKRSEMVSANGCNGSGNRNCIYSDHSFKLFTSEGIVNSSKSWCNLPAKDPIAEDHPERIAVANLGDVHMVETEISNFTLAVQQSPPCDQFTGHSATVAQRLCDLNVLSSPACNLLSSASFCSTDFGSEEFHTGAESKDCEGMCSDQSNILYIDSSTFGDDQGRVEIYDTVHHVDGIPEFNYIWN